MPASARADPKKISNTEFVAMAGGALLAVSLFLPWYSLENSNAVLDDTRGPAEFTGWEAHPIQRWLLLAAAAAPFILAWIVIRGHALSWPRGELTAVTAIAAFGLILYCGVIDRPGDPSGLVSLKIGWFVAMLGVILMGLGSALRASEVERKRKPPGVL